MRERRLVTRVEELEATVAALTERIDELEAATARRRNGSGASADAPAATDGSGLATDVDSVFDDGTDPVDGGGDGGDAWEGTFDPPATDGSPVRTGESVPNAERAVVGRLRSAIGDLDPVATGMLAYYHEYGPASPVDAHVVAGGDATRTEAYRRNGVLRELGLIEHAGCGGYTTRIREVIVEAHDDRLDEADVDVTAAAVEEALPPARPPETADDWPGA